MRQQSTATDRQPEGETTASPSPLQPSGGVAAVLSLQRAGGNAAVARLVQRAPPGQTPASTGPGPAQPVADPATGIIKAPPPQGQPVVHVPSKVLLSESREHVRHQLEDYFAHNGVDLLKTFDTDDSQFKLGYTGSALDPTSQEPAPGSPEEAYRERVATLVRDEISTLRAECSTFEGYFEQRANGTLGTMLDEAQKQTEKDKERYGGKVEGWVFKDYSLGNTADTANLADYAKKLQAKRQAYLDLTRSIPEAPRAELPAAGVPTGGDAAAYAERQKAIDAAHAKLEPVEADYQALRKEAEGKHPILVSYNLDLHLDTTGNALAGLASDSGDTRAAMVVKKITETLENIETVRKKAAADKSRVWKLDRVIGPTHKLADVQTRVPIGQALREEIVSDRVLKEELDEEFAAATIGVLTIALAVIAALPTGGASLVAAAASTAATVVDVHLLSGAVQDYQFQTAASGSNYDKAKAISGTDTDLFWLAFQIVTTAIGVGGLVMAEAKAIVKSIASLKQEALGLKAATMDAQAASGALKPQYERALANLEAEGDRASAGAGKRLREEVVSDTDPARVRRTGGPDSEPKTPRVAPPTEHAIMTGRGGEPMTQADAFSEYHQQIEKNPNREYAVLRKGKSDQFCVVIGEEKKVQIPASLPEDWGYVTHYHPNFDWLDAPNMRLVESNFVARIPSEDDMMGAMTRSSMTERAPVTERVDWRDPSRNSTTVYQTTYGYTPKPDVPGGTFWVQYPNEMGGMSRKTFASMGEYRTWFGGLAPAGPPTVRTPTH